MEEKKHWVPVPNMPENLKVNENYDSRFYHHAPDSHNDHSKEIRHQEQSQ